ncbi:YceI family protein [Novosphingobium sp. TH158]|uniref:YceI family protein n=1 Tax=Novosphingobium sp. TH158 TaxID=2067455 RepID=UPI0013047C15|nr:YceI family protein [Novosphingobium sp. TH158]
MRLLLALVPLLATAATAASTPAYRYQIDSRSSLIDAKVTVLGIARKSAQFPKMSGGIVLSPGQLGAIRMDVAVDARAMATRDPKVGDQLKGPDFLDVARHPMVSFSGQRMTMTGPQTAQIAGQLTARGTSRPTVMKVTFATPPAQITGREPVQITAQTTIDRRQFGMNGYGGLVGKDVTITIKARMVPN